jgi:DNA-binding beta-propeller fold protein YncE
MKRFTLNIIFFISISTALLAQSYSFKYEIGNFKSASAFSLTPGGFFYVTDKANNDVIKLDTLNKVLKSIGGYGWSNSTFDEPVDIFATDLRVYVTDKNNNRIQVFDKDLNFLFFIKTDDISSEIDGFQYPLSCSPSIQGDIYVLDSDNSRVMKFNSRGNFSLEFGSYNSGNFLLSNPIKLALSQDSKVFVLDENNLNVFDQYGMGLIKLKTKSDLVNLNIMFNNLIVNSKDSLYFQNLKEPLRKFNNITPINDLLNSNIVEAIMFNNNLYILTETSILVFSIHL